MLLKSTVARLSCSSLTVFDPSTLTRRSRLAGIVAQRLQQVHSQLAAVPPIACGILIVGTSTSASACD